MASTASTAPVRAIFSMWSVPLRSIRKARARKVIPGFKIRPYDARTLVNVKTKICQFLSDGFCLLMLRAKTSKKLIHFVTTVLYDHWQNRLKLNESFYNHAPLKWRLCLVDFLSLIFVLYLDLKRIAWAWGLGVVKGGSLWEVLYAFLISFLKVKLPNCMLFKLRRIGVPIRDSPANHKLLVS